MRGGSLGRRVFELGMRPKFTVRAELAPRSNISVGGGGGGLKISMKKMVRLQRHELWYTEQ